MSKYAELFHEEIVRTLGSGRVKLDSRSPFSGSVELLGPYAVGTPDASARLYVGAHTGVERTDDSGLLVSPGTLRELGGICYDLARLLEGEQP